ncbi:MAG: DUF2515 domain-containing protein [Candidatus Pristimantibacillus sp.]
MNGKRVIRKGEILTWLQRFIQLPGAALSYAIGKWKGLTESHQMVAEALPLQLSHDAVAELTVAWSKLEVKKGGTNSPVNATNSKAAGYQIEAALPLGDIAEETVGVGNDHGSHSVGSDASDASDMSESGVLKKVIGHGGHWKPMELALIEHIQAETVRCNRNNVTRTEAYRLVYNRRPELHWAMLAHLVSRNGGWNMTDLQGEWIPRLLNADKREAVFQFLETANSFIFHDAYPQLLLYEWSLHERRPLFHLLPAFGVSCFMRPVWERFWQRMDPVPLTVALIVNEQHYIERRIVQHPYFREKVVDTLFFGMQSLLQLNALLIPYSTEGELKLAGLVLERFANIKERIEFGKRLYAMLFGVQQIRKGALQFAQTVRHTGSRSDYARELFAKIRRESPERLYKERLNGGRLLSGAAPLYSPELGHAWPDRELTPPGSEDWFHSAADITAYFRKLPLPHSFEMTNEYGLLLNKIELAVLAAQQIK